VSGFILSSGLICGWTLINFHRRDRIYTLREQLAAVDDIRGLETKESQEKGDCRVQLGELD
jgi:hypothetical protein